MPAVRGSVITPARAEAAAVSGPQRYTWSSFEPERSGKFLGEAQGGLPEIAAHIKNACDRIVGGEAAQVGLDIDPEMLVGVDMEAEFASDPLEEFLHFPAKISGGSWRGNPEFIDPARGTPRFARPAAGRFR